MDSFKVTVDGYGIIEVPYPKSRKKKHYSDAIGTVVANVMSLVAKPQKTTPFHPAMGMFEETVPDKRVDQETEETAHRCMYRTVKPIRHSPWYVMKCVCGERYLLPWVSLVGRID